MKRLLIVEDEANERFTLARLLELAGYEVSALPDASGALAQLREGDWHALITDDGLQLQWCNERYLAVPSTASVRLWKDSRNALLPGAIAAPCASYTPKERLQLPRQSMPAQERVHNPATARLFSGRRQRRFGDHLSTHRT